MKLDQKSLGRRLKEARENRDLSQDEAARSIGIPRTSLGQIEAGNRSLSTLELAELAKLYRRAAADFFQEDGPQAGSQEDPLLILHRLQPELAEDREVNRQVARCFELCSVGVRLLKALGMHNAVAPPCYELRSPTRASEASDQGERVAEQERMRLGLGYGPIADMADLIVNQGVWASGVRGLPEGMSGSFLRQDSIGLVILVNFGHKKPRKRFSYAHEYGHALMDRMASSAIVTSKSNSLDFIERRANAFAAAFLMPRDGVRWFLALLGKGGVSRRSRVTYSSVDEPIVSEERNPAGFQEITVQDVLALADHFGVSYPAAVYRLDDLNYLSTTEKKHLLDKQGFAAQLGVRLSRAKCVQGPVRRGRGGEPKPDRELIGQILWLAIEARRRGEISRGGLIEIGAKLDISEDQILDMVESED